MSKKITAAAIEHHGEIYTGKDHAAAQRKAREATRRSTLPDPMGFVDDEGNFLNREEAAEVALNNGQIKRLQHHPTQLFAEELNLKDE